MLSALGVCGWIKHRENWHFCHDEQAVELDHGPHEGQDPAVCTEGSRSVFVG
jgi:hypothetical protein